MTSGSKRPREHLKAAFHSSPLEYGCIVTPADVKLCEVAGTLEFIDESGIRDEECILIVISLRAR